MQILTPVEGLLLLVGFVDLIAGFGDGLCIKIFS